jgi:hypothetical protein
MLVERWEEEAHFHRTMWWLVVALSDSNQSVGWTYKLERDASCRPVADRNVEEDSASLWI